MHFSFLFWLASPQSFTTRGKEVKGDLGDGGRKRHPTSGLESRNRDIPTFGFSAWKGDGWKESGK